MPRTASQPASSPAASSGVRGSVRTAARSARRIRLRTRRETSVSSSRDHGLRSKGRKSAAPPVRSRKRSSAAAAARSQTSGSTPRDHGRSATPSTGPLGATPAAASRSRGSSLGAESAKAASAVTETVDASTPSDERSSRDSASRTEIAEAARHTARVNRAAGADVSGPKPSAWRRSGRRESAASDGGARVVADASRPDREERLGVEAPVVLEEPAAAEDHEVRLGDLGRQRLDVAPRDRGDAVPAAACPRGLPRGRPGARTARGARVRPAGRRGSPRPRCCRNRSSRRAAPCASSWHQCLAGRRSRPPPGRRCGAGTGGGPRACMLARNGQFQRPRLRRRSPATRRQKETSLGRPRNETPRTRRHGRSSSGTPRARSSRASGSCVHPAATASTRRWPGTRPTSWTIPCLPMHFEYAVTANERGSRAADRILQAAPFPRREGRAGSAAGRACWTSAAPTAGSSSPLPRGARASRASRSTSATSISRRSTSASRASTPSSCEGDATFPRRSFRGRFDLLVANDVVEHVISLEGFLTNVARLAGARRRGLPGDPQRRAAALRDRRRPLRALRDHAPRVRPRRASTSTR